MANYSQLTKLTTDQRTDFQAGKGRFHFEVWVIDWPSPDGTKAYAWSNWLNDTRAEPFLTTWLASVGASTLIPAFVPQSRTEVFTEITHTAGFGDDVATLRFSNIDREIERQINAYGSGVKATCYWIFPEVDGGYADNYFYGQLQTPRGHNSTRHDFITLTVVQGLGSSNIQVPNYGYSPQCTVRYPVGPGGVMSLDQRLNHPCTYNRDLDGDPDQTTLGGAKGLLNGDGQQFTTCPHTQAACIERFGHDQVYMGTITVIDTEPVGLGEHKTYSTTKSRFGQLADSKLQLLYGTGNAAGVLVNWRNEVNPSPDNADAGTKVTLFFGGVGPISDASNFKLMEATPQGIDYRLGTEEQTATVFSTNVPNYNRRVVFNANKNPTNPVEIQVDQLKFTFDYEGLLVRVYSDATTFTTQYSNNAAWCVLDWTISTWYGLRLDPARLKMTDFIYWAGKQRTFNAIVEVRSAQQLYQDALQNQLMLPPVYYNGEWRWLPIEELDLMAGDIPTFSDIQTDPARNIVYEERNKISSVTINRLDPGELINDVYVIFEDADNKNVARPAHFPDWSAQKRAGANYGDETTVPITKSYSAFGVTNLAEVIPLGATLRDLGPFNGLVERCGLANNGEIKFYCRPARNYEALELHIGKAIFLDSTNVDPAIYLDPNGDPYAAWIVKQMTRTTNGGLVVTAQAYGKAYWDSACSPSEGYVVWDTPDPNVIDGPHGTNTKVLSVDGSCIVTGDTWPDSINPDDVVLDRAIYTVDMLPSTGVHNITYPSGPLGFKLFTDGTVWIYHEGGVDFGILLPAGSVASGDTLGMEYDRNGGSPLRRYKHNGVTILTDTGVVLPENGFALEVDGGVGDQMGDVYWQVFPCNCVPPDKGSLQNVGGLDAVFIGEDWTVWPKSFSIWIRLDAYPASDGTIMALEMGADFRLYVDSTGHLVWHSGSTTSASSGTLSLDTWYHVALTAAAGASGAARKVYLNGTEVISSSGSNASNGSPSSVQFYLANDNGSLNGLECSIAAFHAWNLVLTPTQVLADYNAACYEISSPATSIRYWFPMHNSTEGLDDGSGNGVLASTSGTYITAFPPIEWCTSNCTSADEQQSGDSGGDTVILPTDEGELIGDSLIGDELAG